MSLWPDIIVGKPDSPEVLLAIEVRTDAAREEAAEEALREYMVRRNCPAGMLVTAENILFLRNPYTGYESNTIRRIGHCRTVELLGAMLLNTASESTLVLMVEQWLESLGTNGYHSWPPSAEEAIESCVLPAVIEGSVRSTGPRWRRKAS
jgi:hypothetical protein